MKRGEELKPGFKKTTLTPIKGKRGEDHVAHQDRSDPRGHLHRAHARVEQKPVHRPGHVGVVVQIR